MKISSYKSVYEQKSNGFKEDITVYEDLTVLIVLTGLKGQQTMSILLDYFTFD